MGKRTGDKNNRVIASNRRARHDYAIEETFTAGLVLTGSEVKSLRDGRVSIGDGHVEERDGELYLANVQIQEYPWAHMRNHEPTRRRKLLMHRREIHRVATRINERGYSGVPLALLFVGGKIKVTFGLGKGKRAYDKRQDIKTRDARREMDRARKH